MESTPLYIVRVLNTNGRIHREDCELALNLLHMQLLRRAALRHREGTQENVSQTNVSQPVSRWILFQCRKGNSAL